MSAMTPPSLREQLLAEPQRFAFAQIIDLLEQLDPPASRMGKGSDPGAEAVRLTAAFGLAFHGSAIGALKPGAPGMPPHELAVNFFGLGGAQGPLPEAYVELIVEQLRRRDHGGAEFLAMFQHRLLSFVYRSESEFRVAAPFAPPHESSFMPALNALLGLPTRAQQPVLAPILLAHAPLVVQQRRSMSGLLALLGSHFRCEASGAEFAGSWLRLPEELQTELGPGGQNDLLGIDAVLGDCAWDPNGAIEIRFAPMPMALYASLLDGQGAARRELSEICGYYLGPQIRCYVQLELDATPDSLAAWPDLAAHTDDPYALGGERCNLGHTAWLQAPPRRFDVAERGATMVVNDGFQGQP